MKNRRRPAAQLPYGHRGDAVSLPGEPELAAEVTSSVGPGPWGGRCGTA